MMLLIAGALLRIEGTAEGHRMMTYNFIVFNSSTKKNTVYILASCKPTLNGWTISSRNFPLPPSSLYFPDTPEGMELVRK